MCHVNHRMAKKRTIFRILHERDEGLMDNVCLYYRLNSRAKGFVGGSYTTRKASSGAPQKSVLFLALFCVFDFVLWISEKMTESEQCLTPVRGCTVHVPL